MINLRLVSLIAGMAAVTFGPAVVAANFEPQATSNESTVESAEGYMSDAAITTKVKSTILASDALNVLEINVETSNGVVQLSGFVAQEEDIDTAARVALSVEGVKDVKNDIKVKSDAS
ncbi:Osmotically-inducible protein Y [Pseudidiomarina piscicola]|uniref:Osmotically-inducible protein Y n=1 Tax=Pseudidiomarina piscicola TaxID=2614830 RepID=A0A6S6WMM0_9GAMM|nr:BON domain-containing protein [Pseudidiomarina piscicola]CAB0150165.1 Osmotically-inducible protein Y [Pseudidiomarina piscicola]VZT39604.1 Osmotically-inducible protein Y [Pseudomonas aeruginosa]